MKIGIVTDSIREKLTGIGNYSKNFIENLLKVDKKNKYSFIDYERNKFNCKNLIFVKHPLKKIFKTYVWHNILPLKTRRLQLDFIFNLSGCPHFLKFKQKEIFFVYDLSWLVAPETHPQSRVLIYKLLFAKTIKNCHKIVVISKSTKNDLIRYYKIPSNKIVVVYPSLPKISVIQKKPKIVIKKPYILYLGTLEPRKNITLIIEALYQLKSPSLFPYQLIISGKKGWGYSGIFRLVKKLHLEKDVIFTGYVSEAEKKYLYKNAKLFIYPSFYEGFGIPPLEAMAYGCPVITSDTSSLPEVVSNAGIMVNPYNIDELALTIKKVLNDKKLKIDMIKKGFKQEKKFHKNPSEKILDVYKGLI